MDKKLDTLYDICDTVSHELEEANEKISKAGGKLSAGDVEYIDKLTHTLKSLKTTIAMIEAENGEYSGKYWDGKYYHDGMPENNTGGDMSHRGMSNARGRGTYAKRDSMGRYSSERGAKEEFISEIYELMEKAPDEKTRRKFERFVNEMQ